MNNVNELNGERLIMGSNFFNLSDFPISNYYKDIEEILFIAKMSGYDFFFSSNKGVKSHVSKNKCVPEHLPQKANDMINIKYPHNNQTVFYLTLTYHQEDKSFVEFGLNPMTDKIQQIVQQCDEHKDIMHSKYFYATTNFDEIKKVLKCALEIAKNI